MYSSSYSQVKKLSPAQKKMQYHSKGKSCGYYMRIIFFFSSLIQSLIIVSLVLFLIYGKTEDSASSSRVQDLEKSFSELSIENVELKKQRKNLTNILNNTITEKAKNDWDLNYLREITNKSISWFQFNELQMHQLQNELNLCKVRCFNPQSRSIPQPTGNICGPLVQQMKAGLELLESNLTQTKRIMTMEKEQIAKERDNLNLETIHLRRDKSTLEKELELSKQSTKDQFSQLLASVSGVSKALLEKIDSLFPEHLRFQITCLKQKEHLEQIQSNCTNLSREVENKLQYYLNIVGDKVSNMQNENNHLKAENWRLSEDYRWCSQNRTNMMNEHKRSGEEVQLKHDQEKERLLMDKMKLNGEIEILKNSVKYKNAEMDILREQYNHLNMSCTARNGLGGYSGGALGSRQNTPFGGGSFGGGSSHSSSSSYSLGQSRTGTTGSGPSSSSGLGYSGAASAGAGSSSSTFQQSGSRSGLTSVGSGVNKPASTGFGSPFGSSLNQGSSGTGLNKPDSGRSSTGFGSPFGSSLNQGSSGTGLNKPDSGRSSTGFGSPFGSSLNQGSSGTGLNKPDSGKSSTGIGSPFGSSPNKPSYGVGSSSTSSGTGASSGSSSSASKPSSSLSSLFGLGSSSSEQSRTGSVPGRTSSGVGNSGTGSAFGGGKTNGQASSPAYAQHIKELQHLINPPRPQEKQDLARILG
ncbi:plasmalemma vesicle associated protein a isoform X2 [Cyprinodon tularosa]|uniref:plasmalemma vesicle associated protein a isoform X2 n=1 Tax=Cyprinodon tularosa TaxID=77115 RepID=UPI0018E28A5B|nr:plasmalemma vesicle associated protein a isoform X2 [Cyprinodon tularosa]